MSNPSEQAEELASLIKQCPPWYKSPSLVKLYFLLLAPMCTSTALGFDLSMTNSLQSIDTFMEEFNHPSGATLGFYGAAMSVGGILACFFGGSLSDRFGRRLLCFVGSVIVVAMAFMQTFATNFDMFVGGKLILGVGVALQQLGAPVLITELAHPKQRVTITSIYNTGIFIGLILGAWISFGTFTMASEWSWKLPCIMQSILPSYQAVMIWLCPESPRWLMNKGRLEEARRMLIKWHGNGVEDDIVRLEIQEIVAGIEADETEVNLSYSSIKSILGSKGNRHRLWICLWTAVGSQCMGSNLISSYLPKILDQVGMTTSKEKTLINGINSIECWVIAIIFAVFIHRLKRRTMFLASSIGLLVTFIVWTALAAEYIKTDQERYGIGVVVMIFIFNIFSASVWIPMVITYPLETVTTKQRGVFFAWTLFCVSCSGFIVSYINPIAIENITWKYYIIQCVFNLVMCLIIYFTFVETKGLTLEEIATIFDGDEAFRNETAVAAIKLDDLQSKEAADHVEEVSK